MFGGPLRTPIHQLMQRAVELRNQADNTLDRKRREEMRDLAHDLEQQVWDRRGPHA